MGLNLRWIFFSESLPQGKGWSEILWTIAMTILACLIGSWTIVALTVGEGFEREDAFEASWGLVFCLGLILFTALRFRLFQAALIALGLALTVRGFNERYFDLWQLEVAFGFWLVLRFFSMGPYR